MVRKVVQDTTLTSVRHNIQGKTASPSSKTPELNMEGFTVVLGIAYLQSKAFEYSVYPFSVKGGWLLCGAALGTIIGPGL